MAGLLTTLLLLAVLAALFAPLLVVMWGEGEFDWLLRRRPGRRRR